MFKLYLKSFLNPNLKNEIKLYLVTGCTCAKVTEFANKKIVAALPIANATITATTLENNITKKKQCNNDCLLQHS